MAQHPMQFVALAAIASSHGVHGRVKLKLFSESLESFKALTPHCIYENGDALSIKVTSESAGMPVATIDGVKNRNASDLLRGKLIGVHRKNLPEINDNNFYHTDLIGLQVLDENGTAIGTTTSIDNFGAGDIVSIALNNGQEEMLPLTDNFFPEIDLNAGTATAILPDILPVGADEKAQSKKPAKAKTSKTEKHDG